MTPQFKKPAQRTELSYTSLLLSALIGATWLVGGFAVTAPALASPASCQTLGSSRFAISENPLYFNETPLRTLPFPLLIQRDPLRDLLPTPILKTSLLMGRAPFHFGGSVETCWSPSFRKTGVVNQSVMKSSGQGPFKSVVQMMSVPALQYNAKRMIHKTRTIPLEMALNSRDKIPSIIGPMQEQVRGDYVSFQTRQPATTVGSPTVWSLFESQPILTTDEATPGFRLPGNESLRMNMTTTQALHGGNCATDCQ